MAPFDFPRCQLTRNFAGVKQLSSDHSVAANPASSPPGSRTVSDFWLLFGILALKGLLGALLLWRAPLPLAPDEAQYWTWSLDLNWGYFSKPPGIAWQIALFCRVLQSHSPLAIRMGSLLLAFLTPLLFFRSCRGWGLQCRASLLGGLCLAFCPAGILGQFAATTDVGLLFALSGALCPLSDLLLPKDRALQPTKPTPEMELGFWICCGALFKWTALLILPLLMLRAAFWKRAWQHPQTICLLFGWTLLGLAPSLYWNWRNDGVTLRHVLGQVTGTGALHAPHLLKRAFFLAQYIGGQIALLSPSLVWLFARCALPGLATAQNRLGARAVFRVAAPPAAIFLGYFLLAACSRRVQANWALSAYPLICLVLAAEYRGRDKERQLLRGIVLSALFSSLALAVPYAQEAGWPLPWSLNGFQQCMGWQRLAGGLARIKFDREQDFVIADTYQLVAALTYCEFAGDELAPLYYFNLRNLRRNSFDRAQPPTAFYGKSAIYITLERDPIENIEGEIAQGRARLAPYFEQVDFLTSRVLVENHGKSRRRALYFRGRMYKGGRPLLGRTY